MTTPRIPDEVMREIRAMASNLCKHDEYEIGTEEYNIAIHSYQLGAQAFYLKGRESMAKRIVEWLRSEGAEVGYCSKECPIELMVARAIEAKFLNGEGAKRERLKIPHLG